jgi:proteic killer suppression protein
VIESFGDGATADLFHGTRSARARRFPNEIVRTAVRKMDVLNAVRLLEELRSPPGNRLEALKGDWKGYHSIRVNQQWRLVFKWERGAAHQVRLIDYH